ncbi:hypothetical protein [uncultured Kordia sp.]|uniref:hypothetical protein n=1 Tax=uncultured Kordia sp. TaxID=507699 RepID=UPI00260AB994|nr:hypothetical protein [uncultured Kordia sp.]
MKLVISKNQADKKGFFGGNKGVNFSLTYRVQLTEDEQKLIKKYKVEDETLMTNDRGDRITIQDMINGRSLTTQNIEVLQNNENIAINVCKTFKNYLSTLKSFGGKYILDFKDDGIYTPDGDKLE